MLIDSHQHVFWHQRNDEGLIADMDEHGIDLAWLLTWEIPPYEDNFGYHRVLNPTAMRPDGTHAGIPLADILRTRDRYPRRFVAGYCPDPRLEAAPELFEAAYRIHGVRVCGEFKHRVLMNDPRCINLFRKAGDLGCPVVLHLDKPYLPNAEGQLTYQKLWYGGTVQDLRRCMEACPQTTFVGHAPGFWREISGDADTDPAGYPRGKVVPGGRLYELFDQCPNLVADLSAGSGRYALERDMEHARHFVVRYADRLLFGRDYYGGELMATLKALDLPAEVQEKVFFRNAMRLVPIG